MTVGVELREPIRSHHDIERDNVKYFKRATKVRLQFLRLGSPEKLSECRRFGSSSTRPWRDEPHKTATQLTSSSVVWIKSVSSR